MTENENYNKKFEEIENYQWMTLKIHLLPLLMKETESFIEKYINFINEIRTSDLFNKRQDNQEEIRLKIYAEMRSKIKSRISNLDEFYELNIHDSKVNYFEKMKLKLKKLLTYQPEILNLIENNTTKGIVSNTLITKKG